MRNLLDNLLIRPNTRLHVTLIQLVISLHFVTSPFQSLVKSHERDY